MNEEQKAKWEALKASISACGTAGVNGDKVAELKSLAAELDALLTEE